MTIPLSENGGKIKVTVAICVTVAGVARRTLTRVGAVGVGAGSGERVTEVSQGVIALIAVYTREHT